MTLSLALALAAQQPAGVLMAARVLGVGLEAAHEVAQRRPPPSPSLIAAS